MAILALNGGNPTRKEPFSVWPIYDEMEEIEVLKTLRSRKWRGDYELSKSQIFSQKFSKIHNASYGVCTFNGSVALEIALRAAQIRPKDEVIIPAYTHISILNAVLDTGAVPVIVDINPDTYCISADKVYNAISSKTRSIILIHFAGYPCDENLISTIRSKMNDIKIIEDCSFCHNAKWLDFKNAARGDIGIFSFNTLKLMTCGEGGLILTNGKELYEKCDYMISYGKLSKAFRGLNIHPGNYRMTEFQAAILLCQLKRIEDQTVRRIQNAMYLSQELTKIPGISVSSLNRFANKSSYGIYILNYEKEYFNGVSKELFIKALQAEGISGAYTGWGILYKTPAYMNNFEHYTPECPVMEATNERIVWLPHNVLLGTKNDLDTIVEAVNKIQIYSKELR